ncbi:MAG: ATP-binding protein [Christensenellales bacterium]|nr:ATP-binding protein [Christensenellales bacterium]
MYRETAKLLLYSHLGEDCILTHLSKIFYDWEHGLCEKPELIRRIYVQIKCLLDLATIYGFDCNLWHDYLTLLLITNENSFSLTCERTGASEGSVNRFAIADYEVFKRLFHFDFTPIEADLGIDCFSILSNYCAIPKKAQKYYRNVSEKVRALSAAIRSAATGKEIFRLVTEHYRTHGVGMFGLNRAFRITADEHGKTAFHAINNIDTVTLNDLIGYEVQKQQLRDNIEAFVAGLGCNNMLLYGDAGTGKSTSVKAILNEYFDRGLRVIEIYKHQFGQLSEVISKIKNRNYRFMIFIDDLSFEEHEVEYKFLKAVIEGGVETRPDNVLICATSNRRHLIQETWKDRNDMEFNGDVHRSDTMEEKLSLAARFGCAINYSNPDRRQYHEIVLGIAKRHPHLRLSEEALLAEANKWEIRHGGISGRTAQQFIDDLSGKQARNEE